MQIRVSPNGKSVNKSKKSKQQDKGAFVARQEYPQSTNVSSPMQAATKRRVTKRTRVLGVTALPPNRHVRGASRMSDDDSSSYHPEADSGDAFEPTSELLSICAQKRRLGPPITIDKKLKCLDSTHRMVVDDFMVQAATENERVRPSPQYLWPCLSRSHR